MATAACTADWNTEIEFHMAVVAPAGAYPVNWETMLPIGWLVELLKKVNLPAKKWP